MMMVLWALPDSKSKKPPKTVKQMTKPAAMAHQMSLRNLSKGLQVSNKTSRPTTAKIAAQTVEI